METGFRMLWRRRPCIGFRLTIRVIRLAIVIASVMIAIKTRVHLMKSRVLMGMGQRHRRHTVTGESER